jgi:hypothetical protein
MAEKLSILSHQIASFTSISLHNISYPLAVMLDKWQKGVTIMRELWQVVKIFAAEVQGGKERLTVGYYPLWKY